MHISPDPIMTMIMKKKNKTSKHYFQLLLVLSDGFHISFDKWARRFLFEIDSSSKKSKIKMKKKFTLIRPRSMRSQCKFELEIELFWKTFLKTSLLDDLRAKLILNSKTPECKVSILAHLGYNTYETTKRAKEYVSFAVAIAVFEIFLVMLAVWKIESNDFLSQSESQTFWTMHAVFSCLFCFLNVFFWMENQTSSFFLFFFMLLFGNFFSFSLLILRLLYRIGRCKIQRLIHQNPDIVRSNL